MCDSHRSKALARKQKRSFHFWRRFITRERGVEVNWQRRGMRMHDDRDLETMWRCLTIWRYWRTLSRVVYARANQVESKELKNRRPPTTFEAASHPPPRPQPSPSLLNISTFQPLNLLKKNLFPFHTDHFLSSCPKVSVQRCLTFAFKSPTNHLLSIFFFI